MMNACDELILKDVPSAKEFLASSLDYLGENLETGDVIIRVASRMAVNEPNTETGSEIPHFVTVYRSSSRTIVMCAMLTPPHGIVIAGSLNGNSNACHLIANYFYNCKVSIPTVLGNGSVVSEFCIFRQEHCNESFSTRMKQGILCCHKLSKEAGHHFDECCSLYEDVGRPRLVKDGDAAIVIDYFRKFCIDCKLPPNEYDERAEKHWLEFMAKNILYFWEYKDTPVCMVGVQGGLGAEKMKFCSIGPVYTVPEHRGRGYASRCVTYATIMQLRKGHTCILHSDLANDTSNKMYTRIGYVQSETLTWNDLTPKSS